MPRESGLSGVISGLAEASKTLEIIDLAKGRINIPRRRNVHRGMCKNNEKYFWGGKWSIIDLASCKIKAATSTKIGRNVDYPAWWEDTRISWGRGCGQAVR